MSDDLKIVGLLCNWCCYGGADTAGTARMQYSPNIRIIRVMCSGRINPSMIFMRVTTNGQEDQKSLRISLRSLESKRKDSVMNGFQHLKAKNSKEQWKNSIRLSQN